MLFQCVPAISPVNQAAATAAKPNERKALDCKNAERLQHAGRSGAAEPSGPMPPLYTVTEVADYLHVSRSTVYRLIEDGSLHGTRIGQALRFTPDNIRELIALGSVDRGA